MMAYTKQATFWMQRQCANCNRLRFNQKEKNPKNNTHRLNTHVYADTEIRYCRPDMKIRRWPVSVEITKYVLKNTKPIIQHTNHKIRKRIKQTHKLDTHKDCT